jgi:hypothetical protein
MDKDSRQIWLQGSLPNLVWNFLNFIQSFTHFWILNWFLGFKRIKRKRKNQIQSTGHFQPAGQSFNGPCGQLSPVAQTCARARLGHGSDRRGGLAMPVLPAVTRRGGGTEGERWLRRINFATLGARALIGRWSAAVRRFGWRRAPARGRLRWPVVSFRCPDSFTR